MKNKSVIFFLALAVVYPLLHGAKKNDSYIEVIKGKDCALDDEYVLALGHFERAIELASNPYDDMKARLAVVQLGLDVLHNGIGEEFSSNNVLLIPVMNAFESRVYDVLAKLDNPKLRDQAVREGRALLGCISVEVDQATESLQVSFKGSIDNGPNSFSFFIGDDESFSLRPFNSGQQLVLPHQNNGGDDEALSDVERFRKKINTLPLPPEVLTEAKRQLKRLEKLPAESHETHVISTHLDVLFSLPWGVHTEDNNDIEHCKEVLDADHYGLEEIKDRILDYLAVRAHCPKPGVKILCLVGPPGVGKTSLGKSIAKAMGRNFYRLSVGGVHNEAEIRGHRSTYVGAMPGNIVKSVQKAKSFNPLILVDEIDKISSVDNYHGNASAAMLEVLDPEQNDTFTDHYLDVPIDLSQVLFITTANDLSKIPGPLRDRMEIIELSGYTVEEKMEIARRHLLPKALRECGLDPQDVTLSDALLGKIIRSYTREAGVRELTRVLGKLCAKYTRALVGKHELPQFSESNLFDYLGPEHAHDAPGMHRNRIGATNGLAWTPYGGDVLQVEVALMPGKGKLLLTGKLGDVMKESAQAALTYAKAHADEYGIVPGRFTDYDVHIHVPAGAVPKDGPSAGVTILSSLVSALTGRPINASYAMTGEINLNGDVLPIGGLKEKVLAAKQEGIHKIIAPLANKQDMKKCEQLIKGMQITYVEDVGDVLDLVLMPKVSQKPTA